ncbi:MAG TPA: hypothetical protein VIL32_12790 [Steroidobacteraceae bacterium]
MREVTPHERSRDTLTRIIGELRFGKPVDPASVEALPRLCSWCFEVHRVQLVDVVVSPNGRRAVFEFRAPDAESVRIALRHALERAGDSWSCTAIRCNVV